MSSSPWSRHELLFTDYVVTNAVKALEKVKQTSSKMTGHSASLLKLFNDSRAFRITDDTTCTKALLRILTAAASYHLEAHNPVLP